MRHQLVLLPYYSIFDDLSFRVDGTTVTLMGQVVRPTLKSDAENVVKRIEGVDKVINKIEVLPLSGFDDRTRALNTGLSTVIPVSSATLCKPSGPSTSL